MSAAGLVIIASVTTGTKLRKTKITKKIGEEVVNRMSNAY